jgi:hypothetical protein
LICHPQIIWCRFRLWKPQLNFNCFVIILIPKPPSSNTSSIVLFPIYTWITTIWLSIVTTTIPTSSTKELTCLSLVVFTYIMNFLWFQLLPNISF